MIYAIQYLRAMASLLVLISHIRTKSGQYGGNLFAGFQVGYFGVDIFFVISGFVMCFIYARSGTGLREVVPFWIKRFNRIFPLYWGLTCIALGVYLVAPDKVNSSGGHTSVWRSFVLLPGGGKFLIENGWTLSYECYFYAFFTLSFAVSKKWLGASLVGAAIALVTLLGFLGILRDPFLSDPILIEFVFGMMVYFIYLHCPERWLRPAGIFCIALSIAGFSMLNGAVEMFSARWLRAGIPSLLLVSGFLCFERFMRQAPSKVGIGLGDSSYSLYLFHPFLLAFAGILFHRFGLKRYGSLAELIFWAIVFFVTLGSSYVVHRKMEVPLIRWVQKITGVRRAGPPAV